MSMKIIQFSIKLILKQIPKSIPLNMSRNKVDLSNLRKQVIGKGKATTSTEKLSESSSPYFSPLKTRNQRKHIVIKYENARTSEPISQGSTQSVSNKVKSVKKETVSSNTKLDKVKEEVVKVKEEVIEIKQEPGVSDEVSCIDAKPAKSTVAKVEVKKRKSDGSTVKTVKTEKDDKSQIVIKKEEGRSNDSNDSPKQSKWMPKNWEQTLENMRIMRSDRSAPVDTMGCHKCSDDTADEKTQRFHHLIALMLSSQTKDQVTYEAMNRLKANGITGLTPQYMVQIDQLDLEKLLCPVSFYKTKAKHIQRASQMLIDQYDSDIPPSLEELVKLPGVGPKMAHICMKTAWNVVSGIGVDTHVHRISNRLHWVQNPTKEPEKTRIALEKWVPFELWSEINEMMVGFGQTICTPTNPKCGECLNCDFCPSRVIRKK